mgnify:FL=1
MIRNTIKENLNALTDICIIVGGVLVIIAILVSLANLVGMYQCDNYSKMTGKEVQYVFADTCYVREGNTFMRWDEYKAYISGYKGLDKISDI